MRTQTQKQNKKNLTGREEEEEEEEEEEDKMMKKKMNEKEGRNGSV